LDPTQSQSGFVTRTAAALQTPFGSDTSWTQLGAVVVFVLTIALMWRQVVLFIVQEI
jgi:hypothetical protein